MLDYYDEALNEYDTLHKTIPDIRSQSKRAEFYSAISLGKALCFYSKGVKTNSVDSIRKSIFYSEQVFDLTQPIIGINFRAHAYYYLGIAYGALLWFENNPQHLDDAKNNLGKCLLILDQNSYLYQIVQSELDILNQYEEDLGKSMLLWP